MKNEIATIGHMDLGKTTVMVLQEALIKNENIAFVTFDEQEQGWTDIGKPEPMLIRNYKTEFTTTSIDLPKHKIRQGNNAKRKPRKKKCKKTHK